MTLSDAGFYFKIFCWVVGFLLAALAVCPIFLEGMRQRRQDREAYDVDEYLISLERQQNGARRTPYDK